MNRKNNSSKHSEQVQPCMDCSDWSVFSKTLYCCSVTDTTSAEEYSSNKWRERSKDDESAGSDMSIVSSIAQISSDECDLKESEQDTISSRNRCQKLQTSKYQHIEDFINSTAVVQNWEIEIDYDEPLKYTAEQQDDDQFVTSSYTSCISNGFDNVPNHGTPVSHCTTEIRFLEHNMLGNSSVGALDISFTQSEPSGFGLRDAVDNIVNTMSITFMDESLIGMPGNNSVGSLCQLPVSIQQESVTLESQSFGGQLHIITNLNNDLDLTLHSTTQNQQKIDEIEFEDQEMIINPISIPNSETQCIVQKQTALRVDGHDLKFRDNIATVSPNDSLGNEHLTWNESSTPDTVPTPTVHTAPVDPMPITAECQATHSPIKLVPITKNMRYNRFSKLKTMPVKSTTKSTTAETVPLAATPPRKSHYVEDCYSTPRFKTQWSTQAKIAIGDPYDAPNIQDDDSENTFEALFPCNESCKKLNVVENHDDSINVAIGTVVAQLTKIYNLSSKQQKQKYNKKRKAEQKVVHQGYKLVHMKTFKNTLREVITEQIFSKDCSREKRPYSLLEDEGSTQIKIQKLIALAKKDIGLESPINQSKTGAENQNDLPMGISRSGYRLLTRERIEKITKNVISSLRVAKIPVQTVDRFVQANIEANLVDVAVQTPSRFPMLKACKNKQKSKEKRQQSNVTLDDNVDKGRLKQATLSQYTKKQTTSRQRTAKKEEEQCLSEQKPCATVKKKEAFRSQISFSTATSEESMLPSSLNVTSKGTLHIDIDIMPEQCGSILEQILKLQLSQGDTADEVIESSQQTSTGIRNCRRYANSICLIHSISNPLPIIGPFNDPSICPEEFLAHLKWKLAENIEHKSLPSVEHLYDAFEELETDFIEKLLIEGDYYGTQATDDQWCEDSDEIAEEMDSGMDETIKPTHTIQCSSAKGSQEPRWYFPDCSPIRYSGTPAGHKRRRSPDSTPVLKQYSPPYLWNRQI